MSERNDVQKRTDSEDRIWMASVLASAQCVGFYGSFDVIMEAGSIKRVEKREKLMPPHLARKAGGNGSSG